MYIKQKTVSKKIIIAIALAVCLAAGYLWYASAQSGISEKTSLKEQTSASDDEKKAGQQTKDETVQNNDPKNPTSSPSSAPPSDPATVPLQISASSQNGSTYQIRVLIDGVISGSTCTLTLTQGGKTVTKATTTQTLAQSSTCQGFDVPVSELSQGTWQIKVALSGSAQGSATGTIEVQ